MNDLAIDFGVFLAAVTDEDKRQIRKRREDALDLGQLVFVVTGIDPLARLKAVILQHQRTGGNVLNAEKIDEEIV